MLKLAIVFGTRPEAIKMAPLVRACQKVAAWDTRVIITGQHREMVDQVLDLFALKADFDLNIMSHGQTLNDISERTLRGMAGIFASGGLIWSWCTAIPAPPLPQLWQRSMSASRWGM